MECRLAGETEVLGENLPQRHFRPSQNPTRPDPGLNTGRRGGKPATNRLSYGAACIRELTKNKIVDYGFGSAEEKLIIKSVRRCSHVVLYRVRRKNNNDT
jgi:hypothetical protein